MTARSPTEKTKGRKTRARPGEGLGEASDSSRASSVEDVSRKADTGGEDLKTFISHQMADLKREMKDIKKEMKVIQEDIKEEISQINNQMDLMKNQWREFQKDIKTQIDNKFKRDSEILKNEIIDMINNLERKMEGKLENVKKDFKHKIDPIAKVVEQQVDGIKNLEKIAEASTVSTAKLITEQERLLELLSKVTDKCTQLEGYQRRQNLRIAGIPEGLEKHEDTREFTAKLLQAVLSLDDMPVLARAHRVGRRQTSTNAPPRQIIVKLQYDFTLEDIMRRASRTKNLMFQGQRISIYRDYPPEVARKRKAFNEAKNLMRGVENLRYGLNYPAILRVTYNNVEHFFKTPTEAMEFAKQFDT